MKLPARQPSPPASKSNKWNINHIKGAPAVLLGQVEAPDEASAFKRAIEEFKISPTIRDGKRQVASLMGLGSRARGVAGEFHLQGGEYGLWAGGRADLDRHLDEVEPAGQGLGGGRRRRDGTRELAADPDPAVGLDLDPIPRLPAEPGDGQSRAAGLVHDVGPPLGRRRVGARGQGERREVPVGPLPDDPGPAEAGQARRVAGLEDHPLAVPQDAVDRVGGPEVDQRRRLPGGRDTKLLFAKQRSLTF